MGTDDDASTIECDRHLYPLWLVMRCFFAITFQSGECIFINVRDPIAFQFQWIQLGQMAENVGWYFAELIVRQYKRVQIFHTFATEKNESKNYNRERDTMSVENHWLTFYLRNRLLWCFGFYSPEFPISWDYQKWIASAAVPMSIRFRPSWDASVFWRSEKRKTKQEWVSWLSVGAFRWTCHSLFQAPECIWLDDIDFIFVECENLQSVKPFECSIVNLRYAVVIQIENQQMV